VASNKQMTFLALPQPLFFLCCGAHAMADKHEVKSLKSGIKTLTKLALVD
jgi:hypothetical protein